MDDKEKEKFGVIIDKNDQNKDDQSSVENKSDEQSDIKKEEQPSNEEILKTSDNKQPESDKVAEIDKSLPTDNNLNENVINKDQEVKSESPVVENTTENTEEKKEHQVIHKKDDRLHIYVRQDKYKGELKSKNWVGRLYIDVKQKIST